MYRLLLIENNHRVCSLLFAFTRLRLIGTPWPQHVHTASVECIRLPPSPPTSIVPDGQGRGRHTRITAYPMRGRRRRSREPGPAAQEACGSALAAMCVVWGERPTLRCTPSGGNGSRCQTHHLCAQENPSPRLANPASQGFSCSPADVTRWG